MQTHTLGEGLERKRGKQRADTHPRHPLTALMTPYETGVIIIISTLKMRGRRLRSEYDRRIQLRTVRACLVFKTALHCQDLFIRFTQGLPNELERFR